MMRSARGCAWTMKGPRRSDPSPVATMPAPAAPAAVHLRNSLRETRRPRFSESRTHFSAFSSLTRSHLLAQDAVPFGVEATQTQIEGSLAASIGLGGRGMQCGRKWCPQRDSNPRYRLERPVSFSPPDPRIRCGVYQGGYRLCRTPGLNHLF